MKDKELLFMGLICLLLYDTYEYKQREEVPKKVEQTHFFCPKFLEIFKITSI